MCEEVSYEEECCDRDTEVLQRMDSESAPTLYMYELRVGGMGRDGGMGSEGGVGRDGDVGREGGVGRDGVVGREGVWHILEGYGKGWGGPGGHVGGPGDWETVCSWDSTCS